MRSRPAERVLRFDVFTLDLSRCVLLRGDAEVPLRPKPFDMLRYLAEHPGRLLPKEELFEAVWPHATVGEDALVKCIGDVREALGERRHLVRTLPKRGYLFDAEVSETAEPPSPRATPTPPHTPSARGEGPGGGQLHTPTVLLVAAPHPDPLPAGGQRGLAAAVSRLAAHHWRRPTALLAAAALVAAVAGAWALRAPPPLAANATHYAILARTILDNERSAKANREALALFDKALAIDPDWVPALLGYARVMVVEVGEGWVPHHERRARLDRAKAAVEHAIKLEADNAGAHQLLGDVLRMRPDPNGAMAALERSLLLQPDAPWTYALMGRVKIDLGRAEAALGDIETALRIKPSELAVHVWYAWAGLAALRAGKDEAAVQWLLKARRARPNYRFVMPLLAAAYALTGREEEGRALMAEYLPHGPRVTMETIVQDYRPWNPTVVAQHRRIAAVLQQLGVPEEPLRTGSAR